MRAPITLLPPRDPLRYQSRRRPVLGKSAQLDIKKKLGICVYNSYCGLQRPTFSRLVSFLKKYPKYSDQKKLKYDNIQRIHRMAGYRSLRLRLNLPARGQRTHTNAKTRRKRKIV